MINLIARNKCAHPGFNKQPSYGVAGTKKQEFCNKHTMQGMVNLHHKKCAHPGCSKIPSFGVAGTKKRTFCAAHAKEGMVCPRSTADEVRSKFSVRGRISASTAPAEPGADGMLTDLVTPAGNNTSTSKNIRRAQASQERNGRGQPSTQPRNGRGSVGQASSSSSSSSSSEAHRPRAPALSPGLRTGTQGPAIVGKDRPPIPQPSPTTGDDDDTSANGVKTEEVTFSTSLVVPGVGPTGEKGAVAHRVGNRRGKRKGCAQPSPAQVSADAADAKGRGRGSSSSSSNWRRGKRARRAADNDVVVLGPNDEGFPVANDGVAHKRKGARVSVKAEGEEEHAWCWWLWMESAVRVSGMHVLPPERMLNFVTQASWLRRRGGVDLQRRATPAPSKAPAGWVSRENSMREKW